VTTRRLLNGRFNLRHQLFAISCQSKLDSVHFVLGFVPLASSVHLTRRRLLVSTGLVWMTTGVNRESIVIKAVVCRRLQSLLMFWVMDLA
jgi:hypothetical protein